VGTCLISIRLRTLAQLFDALDPAPFHEKALDRNAESYLLECAGEHAPHEDLALVVHGPPSLRDHLVELGDAVHAHFDLLKTQSDRQWRRHARLGRRVMLAGALVLASSIALRQLLVLSHVPGAELVNEGLLILGWVAMWRPIEFVLFDRVDHRDRRALLQRLARIEIRFEAAQGD
jgi:hypothetical protein